MTASMQNTERFERDVSLRISPISKSYEDIGVEQNDHGAIRSVDAIATVVDKSLDGAMTF